MSDTPVEEQLPHTLVVTVDEKPFEVFMSFALLNQLAGMVGDPENITLIHVNSDLRVAVLNAMLAKRTEKGKLLETADVEEMNISYEDINKLLTFAAEHVVNFTVAALTAAKMVQVKAQAKASPLMASILGRVG